MNCAHRQRESCKTRRAAWRGTGAILVSLLMMPPALAQVATDGSLGSAVRLVGPTYQIAPNLGLFRGNNLFHSFSDFSLALGERAVFQGAANTRFIIARITGGSPSSINGQLTTAPLGASLFLLNPAGIAFGPGASLNLNGSFHASTASGLRLADGTLFSADPRVQGELGAGSPESFLFTGPGGRISLDGSFLRVPERFAIGLHAGSLLLNRAVFTAPSGQVSLSAFRNSGEIRLDGTRLSGAADGSIQILNGSLVAVSEGAQGLGGGRLVIRGGQVQIEQSRLESRSQRGTSAGIQVEATGALDIKDSQLLTFTTGAGGAGSIHLSGSGLALTGSSLDSYSTGAGQAGDVTLTGRQITLENSNLNGYCGTACVASVRGANIRIDAEESLTLTGSSRLYTATLGAGSAGSISARARDIFIRPGSGMDTSCERGCGSGGAGAISLVATGELDVSGTDNALAFIVANSFGAGNAGRVDLQARNLSLSGNTVVESYTLQSGLSLGITLNADTLRILDGAQVVTSSSGSGPGGPISAIAQRSILISGFRQQPSGKILPSGLFATTAGAGNAGDINITTPVLQVLKGGEINSSAVQGSTGNGGNITIRASESLQVDGGGPNLVFSNIGSNTFSSGNAGRIQIVAGQVILSNGGLISLQSQGSGSAGLFDLAANSLSISELAQIKSTTNAGGRGGQISIKVNGDLDIRGTGPISGSGFQGTGLFTESTTGGNAGSIDVVARNLRLMNGASISSSIFRAGQGGQVRIETQGNLTLSGGSQIISTSLGTGLAGNLFFNIAGSLGATDSLIRTAARSADGGNIALRVGGDTYLQNATLDTAVGNGLGSGGNLDFSAGSLVMRNALISANAFGGSGGNIRIGSPLLIANATSQITASSTLGIDGTVQLDSPAIDLSALLSTVQTRFLDSSLVGAGSCLRRNDGVESRLALVTPRAESVRRLGPGLLSIALPPLPPSSALPLRETCEPGPAPVSALPPQTRTSEP